MTGVPVFCMKFTPTKRVQDLLGLDCRGAGVRVPLVTRVQTTHSHGDTTLKTNAPCGGSLKGCPEQRKQRWSDLDSGSAVHNRWSVSYGRGDRGCTAQGWPRPSWPPPAWLSLFLLERPPLPQGRRVSFMGPLPCHIHNPQGGAPPGGTIQGTPQSGPPLNRRTWPPPSRSWHN